MGGCYIYGCGTLSALGVGLADSLAACGSRSSCFVKRTFRDVALPVGAITPEGEHALFRLIEKHSRYAHTDRTVQLAIVAAREAITQAGWHDSLEEVSVLIGSSRGATDLLEEAHSAYLKAGKVAVASSPLTTLGNISSWVAQDLGSGGVAVSHSVTCSTSLHSIGMALAWLRAGMGKRVLAGGTEASLTGFTIAQMEALRIYSPLVSDDFPCRPCGDWGGARALNTFVLGEGACLFALGGDDERGGGKVQPLARVEAFGWGVEQINSSTSISENGVALQKSMRRALAALPPNTEIDLVVMHAPGTLKGDASELRALEAVFGASSLPCVAAPKWLFGHTFGAAGALGMLYALFCLREGRCPAFPYPVRVSSDARPIRRVMVNAAGFGGNAASVVLGCS